MPASITKELIAEKLLRFDRSFRRDFGITLATHSRPLHSIRMPPAKKDFGKRRKQIITPGDCRSPREKILACWLYTPPTAFRQRKLQQIDGILAMYHDQGLALLQDHRNGRRRQLYRRAAIRARTSPDHGTGYDIADKAHRPNRCAAPFTPPSTHIPQTAVPTTMRQPTPPAAAIPQQGQRQRGARPK